MKTSIPTQKHHTQFAVNMLWFSICLFITVLGIYGCIVKFQWNYLLVLAVTILGVLYYGSNVWSYVHFQPLTIYLEIKDGKATFYGTDEKNEEVVAPQSIEMNKIQRAYLRITRQKVIKYKSFEFQDNSREKNVTEVYFLPDMYDVTEEDMYELLRILKSQFPHIELGYEE